MSTPGPSGASASQFRPLSSKSAIDPLGMLNFSGVEGSMKYLWSLLKFGFCKLLHWLSISVSTALGLRAPLGAQGGYPAAFSIAHPSASAEGAGAYAGLHLMSPQLNGAAAAGTYGRTSLVSTNFQPAFTERRI